MSSSESMSFDLTTNRDWIEQLRDQKLEDGQRALSEDQIRSQVGAEIFDAIYPDNNVPRLTASQRKEQAALNSSSSTLHFQADMEPEITVLSTGKRVDLKAYRAFIFDQVQLGVQTEAEIIADLDPDVRDALYPPSEND